MNCIVRKTLPFVALSALVAFSPSRVEAGPIALPAGTPYQGLAITAAADNGATNPGTLLASLTSLFTIVSGASGTIVGSLTSAVYMNALGFVDFYYQIANSTAPGNNNLSISGLTGFNFGGYNTSVGYYSNAAVFGGLFGAPTAGVNPKSADRSANGNLVTMFFGPPWGHKVFPQQTSSILQIATNSRGWYPGFATVQNHGTATVSSYQVPGPTSASIALFGFVLLGFCRFLLQKNGSLARPRLAGN